MVSHTLKQPKGNRGAESSISAGLFSCEFETVKVTRYNDYPLIFETLEKDFIVITFSLEI